MSVTGDFGITIVCPGEIDFVERTAKAEAFWSIILEGISPEMIERKIDCWAWACCCFNISSIASSDILSICS